MKPILATVSSEIVLRELPIRTIERLRFALSYVHPEYVKAVRMGRASCPTCPYGSSA